MQIGETVYRFFRVPDPSSAGENIDADSMPTVVLRRNGTTVGGASVTPTKISTGYYRASVLIDAAHGWTTGDTWSLDASYAVSGDSTTRCIGGGTIGPRQTGDGYAVLTHAEYGLPTIASSQDVSQNMLQEINSTTGETQSTVSGLPSASQVAAAVWAYASRTLTGIGSVGASIAAAVWAYATRTLTQTAAQVTASQQGEIIVYRSCTFSQEFTGLGDLSDASEIWFSLKRRGELSEDNAQIRISLTGGLERICRAEPDAGYAAYGDITIDDDGNGDITVELEPTAAALLTEAIEDGAYDIKVQRSSGRIDSPLELGTAHIRMTPSHAV